MHQNNWWIRMGINYFVKVKKYHKKIYFFLKYFSELINFHYCDSYSFSCFHLSTFLFIDIKLLIIVYIIWRAQLLVFIFSNIYDLSHFIFEKHTKKKKRRCTVCKEWTIISIFINVIRYNFMLLTNNRKKNNIKLKYRHWIFLFKII